MGFLQQTSEGINNQYFLHYMQKENMEKKLPRNTLAQEETTGKPNQG
jgi:hypothetical protein